MRTSNARLVASLVATRFRRLSLMTFYPIAKPLARRHKALSDALLRTDMYIAPEGWLTQSMMLGLIAFASLATTLALLGLFFAIPFALLVAMATFIALLKYPAVHGRRLGKGADSELPFFICYASMIASIGKPLLEAFEKLRAERIRVFKAMRRIGDLIARQTVFNPSPMRAIEAFASHSPSRRLASFLEGFCSMATTGGSVRAFFERAVRRSLEELEAEYKSFTEPAKLYANMGFIFFVFLPLFYIVSPFVFFEPGAVDHAILLAFVGLPLIALLLLLYLDITTPRLPEEMGRFWKAAAIFLPLLPILFTIFLGAGLPPHASFAISVALASLPLAIYYEIDRFLARNAEKNLPALLSDLTEMRRVGLSIERAFHECASRARYGRELNKAIRFISTNIKIGRSLDEIFADVVKMLRSWYAKAMMYLLHESIETGGATIEMLSELTEFSESYHKSTAETKRGLRVFQAFTYFGALFLCFLYTSIVGILPPFADLFAMDLGAYMEVIPWMIATSVLMLVLVNGKIAEGTVFGSMKHVPPAMLICAFLL